MTNRRQLVGRWGEEAAAEYLRSNDYAIIRRNFRTRHGEIDIVASKDGLLVFVEVRTRRTHDFLNPEDTVTRRKQTFMLSAAEEYIQSHPESSESWQIDVIAVEGTPGEKTEITHFENVIG